MTSAHQSDTTPVEIDTEGGRVLLSGRFVIGGVNAIVAETRVVVPEGTQNIDISGLTHIDTAGAWFLVDQERRAKADGVTLSITGASQAQAQLIETVRRNMPEAHEAEVAPRTVTELVEDFGRKVVRMLRKAAELTSFLGQIIATMGMVIIRPGRLRLTSVVHHCQQVGLNAVPIVALMAFLIGVVLAFQGSAQLRQFGAEVFVVDLIAISVLRELGILLTAIIVAGRSGSAFTAAIGSMKMREEIDAMRTLGLDPVAILVVPRVLALMLMLPALGLIANVSGLLGGALMSWIELGVSPAVFQSRLVSNTDVWHFGVGMIKAPFFALIIGVIGCYEGMLVGGNADSLGRQTSTSVVLAIFMVIVADALFSIFFAVVGV
ncbi:MlaE family lipid ABC transporter permease subunit [Sulfitobacter sp. F26169L]|uniref:ABC transporter permease n=1 Tax=Sulfitobacter sp. F26169L TaxID=2996015 RepID=UPI002260C2D4|nr:MlaE family lipid ABC transporter permease subunit [Sulfitobacter sp. F26169L]MCX7568228.1 MlaE family lipid ABC transporter permease subunit [Sulfitobacter sp. F26169L]